MLTIFILLSIFLLGHGCGPGRKLSDLRKYVQFENYRGADGQASNPACLSCNFDGGNCCWYDDSNAPLHWQRTRFKQAITPKQMKDVTGRNEIPNGDFLAAGSETKRDLEDTANLIAEVPCLDRATLTMKYWKSSDAPELEVCTDCEGAGLQCKSAPRSRIAPSPITFEIGCTSRSKAKIYIKAKHFTQADFVAIDDIQYSGSFCEGGDTGTGTTDRGITGSASNQLLNGCGSLTCDFEKGNTCGWGPARSDYGQWNVNSGREGSAATGIFGDASGSKEGKFAFVGRTTPNVASSTSESSSVYVLQSPRFKSKVPAKLKYRLYDQSVGPLFEVCKNEGLTDCVNRVEGPLSRAGESRWSEEQSIDLEANKPYVISYVVKNLKTNYYVGLDNVKLEPQNGDNNACVAA